MMHRDLFVPSFPLENSLCILNLTVPSSFASGVVVLDVVSCIATTHSNAVGGVSGGYTHCSSANNPHCLFPDSNPLAKYYTFYIIVDTTCKDIISIFTNIIYPI